jgi:hypothetical protein
MSEFRRFLGKKWFLMSTFPFQEIKMEGYTKRIHFYTWIIGWLWAISGIFAGSLLALPLLNIIQVRGTTNETLASTFVAITVGFIIQMVGWMLLIAAINYKAVATVLTIIALAPFIFLTLLVIYSLGILDVLGAIIYIVTLIILGDGIDFHGVDFYFNDFFFDASIIIRLIIFFLVIAAAWRILSFILGGFGSLVGETDNEEENVSIGTGLILPFSLSGLYIYWFFTHLGANFGLVSTSVAIAFVLKILFGGTIFSATGKLLNLLGLLRGRVVLVYDERPK